MGYFKRPIRRRTARRAWLTFLEPSRELPGEGWQRCDRWVRPPAAGFLRFVMDNPGGRKVGLFRSGQILRETREDLPAAALGEMRAAFRWFNTNLPVPRRLPKNAVCWFRADARESLERLRTLVEIFRLAGRPVWMQATRTPGRVVNRDEFQVAAVPYADRRTTATVV